MKIRLGLLSNHSSTNSLIYLPDTFDVKTFIKCMKTESKKTLTKEDKTTITEWFSDLIKDGSVERAPTFDDDLDDTFDDLMDAYVVEELESEPGESPYTLFNNKKIQNRVKEIEQNDKKIKSNCTTE